MRGFIVSSLQLVVTGSTESALQPVTRREAALQLALAYTSGFGTSRDDHRAKSLLDEHAPEFSDPHHCLQLIENDIDGQTSEDSLYKLLDLKGHIQKTDLPQHCRENRLFERAEARYRLETESSQVVFSERHQLYLFQMSRLARMFASRGRRREAEELEAKLVETYREIMGVNHPDTLNSMSHLALLKFWDEGQWNEAEELFLQMAEIKSEVLGAEQAGTLVSIGYLARMYRFQGRLDKAEKFERQVMETYAATFGGEHPDTLISMKNLAAVLVEKGRWVEGEQMAKQVLGTSKRVRNIEHPDMLHSISNLASTYDTLVRWREAEELICRS